MIGDKIHFSITEVYYYLAEALLGQNKIAESLAPAKNALELSQKAENRETTGEAWRILGLIAAKSKREIIIENEPLTAAECFTNALQIFSEIKMKSARARTLRSFAHYENERGKSPQAEQLLIEAKEIFIRLEIAV